jgi:hypothetical protein
MQYRLRTLLIVLALGPVALASSMCAEYCIARESRLARVFIPRAS